MGNQLAHRTTQHVFVDDHRHHRAEHPRQGGEFCPYQEFAAADIEVIVVNDTGEPLPEEDWQKSESVQMVTANRRECSFARNTGAAIAKVEYLHFLDDDDWLLPGSLQRFYDFAQTTDAHWLYGSSQMVDRSGQQLIQLNHGMNGNCIVQMMAGEWIPL